MHFRDRRGKMAIDWTKEYQTFIGEWNNRRNTIVHAERSNEVLTSSDPYMLWFRQYTRLVLSNPSDIAAFGYQGVGGSLEGLVHRVARAYHMADAAHITHDGREGLDTIAEIQELLYDGLQQAHRRDRLHFGHFGEDPYMGVDITVTSMPYPNMPSTEPSTSMPLLHLTAHINRTISIWNTLVRGLPWVCPLMVHLQQCIHRKLPRLNVPITHPSLPLR